MPLQTNVDIYKAVEAELLGSEWRVLMLMVWQMSEEGFVYGMPEELTERTYYRVLRRLEAKGLVKKVGKYWQVDQAFAKRQKPPPDRKPKNEPGCGTIA